MFILPSGVIARIETICRNFLWDGGSEYIRTPLVAWDKVCRPKIEGDLGLKNDSVWNKAALGKLVWWISHKADHLWVKWINHTYLKGQEWHGYCPTSDTSWYWRKLCQVRDRLKDWTEQGEGDYYIAKGYDFLREKTQEVQWSNMVWNQLTIPKHSLVAWLYHHKALTTNAKLKDIGITSDDTCYICGVGAEQPDHLFFSCSYSNNIVSIVEIWLGIQLPRQNLLDWRIQFHGSGYKRDVVNGVLNALIYSIWRQRNTCKFEMQLLRPHKVAENIIKDLKIRIDQTQKRSKRKEDDWTRLLCGR
ncbi:uncharacterized protein LOC141630157 [Silene latifolia]|uniref:uncharacterized protein LOC141630157 n=1 Tax=Silene latifolia TaxID=37657 RepID=UPI003D779A1E